MARADGLPMRPAPTRDSTTNGCLNAACSRSATSRVRMSDGPPGGNVSTTRTGLVGHACA